MVAKTDFAMAYLTKQFAEKLRKGICCISLEILEEERNRGR